MLQRTKHRPSSHKEREMATAKKAQSASETIETWSTVDADAVKQGYEKLAQGFSRIADFNRESVEALMASAGSLAKGFEKTASENSAFAKSAIEEGVAAFRAATASKSVQEALDIQSDYVRSTLEKNLGHFNKLADFWVTTTKAAAEPLSARYSEFVEKIQTYRP
jgi:phasin family protein